MTLIYFILILGATIFVHEFGHFLFAKLANIYVYEFSIGMGKKIFSFKSKKGETEYNIRLIPLGGFVRLAGEDVSDGDTISKDRLLGNKGFWQRFFTMFAGAGFNFLFAFIVLFMTALIWGSTSNKPILGNVPNDYPAYQAGLREGDKIIYVNDKKIKTWDDVTWELSLNNGKSMEFVVTDQNNKEKKVTVKPLEEKDENGKITYKYGVGLKTVKLTGIANSFNYAVVKSGSLFKMMFRTLESLFTGGVSVNDLSGTVGIYSIVDSQAKAGIASLLYLVAFLSINVGVINLIPFPAFDGGRILFLFIEKIKGSPVDPKVENMIHNIGFFLLLGLMIYVTFNDIIKLFR